MPKRNRLNKEEAVEAEPVLNQDDESEVDSESEAESSDNDEDGDFNEAQEDHIKLDSAEMSKITSKINQNMENNSVTAVHESLRADGRTSVIYLGHIPHGFYEEQQTSFFSQFGEVIRLRLSRSKKTGRSRGYGFIEFQDPDVAKVVALTMNKYILFDQSLVCHVLAPEQLQERMWIGANKKHKNIPWRKINKRKHNSAKTEQQDKSRMSRLKSSEKKKRAKLAALGIEYEFVGYKSLIEEKKQNAIEAAAAAVEEEAQKLKKAKKSKSTSGIPKLKKRKTEKTPAKKSAATPSKKEKTPVKKSTATPAKREKTPAKKSTATPAKREKTPAKKSTATPAKKEKTLAKKSTATLASAKKLKPKKSKKA